MNNAIVPDGDAKTATIPMNGLEGVQAIPTLSDRVVNVASVPQRSPLRYPGGKTWLVPEIRRWLSRLPARPKIFIEPFAGGAIASLTAVMDGFTDRAVLCEKDPDIAQLWRCILSHSDQLARRVETFEATPDRVRAQFAESGGTLVDSAFRTLLRNRTNRGGILAKGASLMNEGENGNGVASRWYPKTLGRRIRAIGSYADQFDFFEGDGLSVIDKHQEDEKAAFFIDPPYTASGKRAGRRLYTYNDIDHGDLFQRMSKVRSPFLMTYDASPDILTMAQRHGFHLAKVIMKNTHHDILYELLITSHEISP